ncbi:hydantoinase [Xylariales sp. PMI_506]|nr:hydantoinase [Xylariales sp. PMI_506]
MGDELARPQPRRLRIGIDFGGTNTDGVLDPSRAGEACREASLPGIKSPTSANPSLGIADAITTMLTSVSVDPADVVSVTIGTTHFANAVVERDANKLSQVAVLRLAGPFRKHAPPCVDWPVEMRRIVPAYWASVKGGLEVDGNLIAELDEGEIRMRCREINARGKYQVCPIDTVEQQEERAAALVKSELPECNVLCSREVANLGFLERENAPILNAAILNFAKKTIRSFQKPIRSLGLSCPVFITQNDGTILSGDMAARLPIRTFSSSPTNSMRGAAFLAVMVVDIGGTTADVGLLFLNGFPRQQAACCGSIVRKTENGKLAVGPDSVGYNLTKEAIIFGGNILTATDCTVLTDAGVKIGDAQETAIYKDLVNSKLEKAIDTMKTSPRNLPAILVGGGAIIAPLELKGASKVLKSQWSGVANAIGEAMARVSAVIDTVESTETTTSYQLLETISRRAVERTLESGTVPSTVKIVEMETLPLQYIANKSGFIVRAAGNFNFSTTSAAVHGLSEDSDLYENVRVGQYEKAPTATRTAVNSSTSEIRQSVEITAYKPTVKNRVWYISDTDVSWISTGCYILRTDGGGAPYAYMIRLRQMIREGAIVRVVNPYDVADLDSVGCGGSSGSPTVTIEKLADMSQKATHMIALEIGGGNGLQGMTLSASTNMDLPCVDGDWMGHAYPKKWQTTPVVFNERQAIWTPIAMCDGNGNMGSSVGAAEAPVTGSEMKRWVVEHTISQAWRIGRAVMMARLASRLDTVAEAIIKQCGGSDAAKVIWKGKIVGVERMLKMGADIADREDSPQMEFNSYIKIPFKNENIAAIRTFVPGSKEVEKQEDVLAIVLDLITVIDAQNGEAIGTPEYRYGLLVIVLGIVASDRWTSTQRGLDIGGPSAFGFSHLTYKPFGHVL